MKPLYSLGKRLRKRPSAHCFGVSPNWEDYSEVAREAIRGASRICYPGPHYNDVFEALGKEVFPGNYYGFMGNKIKQTCLFQLHGIPHPKTRLYYGFDPAPNILEDFLLPLVAKTPVGSSRGSGVWLIQDENALRCYLEKHRPAYIQEYLPIDRDLRVVLVNRQVVHAYWRVPLPGEFRSNVSRGARISTEGIPDDALEFAETVADRCGFDEVGLDVCHAVGQYYVLEANMVYGLEGFRQMGMDIYEILGTVELEGSLTS
ncbi:MAG: RimK family alpha-L-glutamate ligase, partial [Syntrophobacteraceae bacterium]|nr:RimK family alpha-L-glutamate ligase [Syntrophobacteraceae bacterium]